MGSSLIHVFHPVGNRRWGAASLALLLLASTLAGSAAAGWSVSPLAADLPHAGSGVRAAAPPLDPPAAPRAFAPEPTSLSNGAPQNFSPYAPAPFIYGNVTIGPNVDGANIAALPGFTITQSGNLTVQYNGTWNPAPLTAADRDWVAAFIVRNGNTQLIVLEANTTVRVAVNNSSLPMSVYFGLPSTAADTGSVSSARVTALLPGGNLTTLNLTAANAGLSLTGNTALLPMLTDSVWFNGSGSYPGSGNLTGPQTMVIFVPADGGVPMEVRAGRVSQWTNASHFPGGRFLALKGGGVVVIGGSFKVTAWTRGSPESSLYLNATVNPTFAVRPDTLVAAGSVGNRSLEATTSWNITQNSVLSAFNYNSVICGQVIRLNNGTYRLFCSWQDNSGGGTSGVDSAWSPDGRTWAKEAGTRYSTCGAKYQINQISIVKTLDGTLRMYYGGQDVLLGGCSLLGSATHISSATSTNEGVTWTLETETLGTFGVSGPDAKAVVPTVNGTLRMYLDSASGLATATSDDGQTWFQEATIGGGVSVPRNVYALASGGYKMYYGTSTVLSRTSTNGLSWSGATTEVSQWGAGAIEAGPILDRGDGVPLILVYSQASGIFLGAANQNVTPPARVDLGGRLSDATPFGANTTIAGSRGAFSMNATVPVGAPLGRYTLTASAGFGENKFRGVVLNRMPQWTGPSDWIAVEDQPLTINFTALASDADIADTLTVFANSPYLNTSTMTLLYPNGVLTDTVVGIINDGHDNVPFTLTVSVVPWDDSPTITLQPSYNATEGQQTFIDLTGAYADEETAAAGLTLSTNLSGAQIVGSVVALNFSTSGPFPATIGVSDGNHTVNATTVIIVSPVNDAPTVSLPASFSGDEDTLITIDLTPYVSDEETDAANLTVTTDLVGANLSGLSLTITPASPANLPFTVTVSDGALNATGGSSLVVIAVNDAPRWLAPPLFAGLQEDVPYTVDLALYAADEETASGLLTYTMSSTHGTIVGTVANFTWGEGILQESIVFTVSDGLRAANITLNVTIAAVNDPPVITNAPPQSWSTGGTMTFQFNVSDPDDASGFQYDLITTNSSYVTLSPSGLLTIVQPAEHAQISYEVRVRDASGGTAGYVNYTFNLPVNHLPVLAPPFSQQRADARINEQFTLTFDALDEDGDQVRASLLVNDSNQTLILTLINPNVWRLSWTPVYAGGTVIGFEATLNGTLLLNDSFGESRFPFTFYVANPARTAPYIDPALPVFEARVGSEYKLDLTSYMHDNDTMDTLDRLTWNIVPQGNASTFTQFTYYPSNRTIVVNFTGEGDSTYFLTLSDPSHLASQTQVVRVRSLGAGTQNSPPTYEPFPWWILLLIAAAAGVGAVLWRSRRGAPAEVVPETAAPVAPPQAAPAARAPPLMAAVPGRKKFLVEDVFLLYQDGRTIFSRTGIAADAVDDPESVGAMLIAVQDFVKDSFRKDSPVDRMGYGDNVILLERGDNCMLAVTVFGEPDRDFRELMSETTKNVQASYAGVIEKWSGNKADFVGVEAILAPVWQLTANLTRGDVLLATTAREVQMLSGVEFFQGFVRLKVGVVNNTSTVITNVTVDLDFNQDVLRLHKIEPSGYKAAAAKVNLGVLHAGEKATLAYYFDPQICTQSMIDGTARYKDAQGSQHVVQMKSRKAEVVCPLFFTKEQANTAMLRRLVETQLNQFDVRAYSIAQGAEPKDLSALFEAMKSTILAHDVQAVRTHEKHNPYAGEGWFYGKTQVKGYQMIIRAAVDAEKARAEFFVASTVMRSVTGLLAELNHQFQEVVESRFGNLDVQSLFDESARNEYADPKAVGKMIEGEAAAGETEAP